MSSVDVLNRSKAGNLNEEVPRNDMLHDHVDESSSIASKSQPQLYAIIAAPMVQSQATSSIPEPTVLSKKDRTTHIIDEALELVDSCGNISDKDDDGLLFDGVHGLPTREEEDGDDDELPMTKCNDFEVPVRFTSASMSEANRTTKKQPFLSKSSRDRLCEYLFDDTRSLETMLLRAKDPFEEGDDTSCSSTEYQEDGPKLEQEDNEWSLPVNFLAANATTRNRSCSFTPFQQELLLDNMESFQTMIDTYRKDKEATVRMHQQ